MCLALISVLASCSTGNDVTSTTGSGDNIETPSTNTEAPVSASDETGSVVLELTNPHPLAGKSLNFDVVVEEIEKADGNTQTDTVESGDSIEVNYVGTLDDGEQFDSSYERNQTLPFTVGAGEMIPGFDEGVLGMQLNQTGSLTLSPEEAYGPEVISETVSIADLRSIVWPEFQIVVGAKIPTQAGDATIIEIQD